MSNVLFLNRLYVPSEAEKLQFFYLQSVTNNFRKELREQEPSKYWQKARIMGMVKQRREKFELIDGGKCEK